MKRSAVFTSMIITVFFLLAAVKETSAKTAGKYNIAFGGYFGLGGATNYYDNREGAFALGIQPEMQFFVIDGLSITYRFLWERIYFDHRYEDLYGSTVEDATMDIAPFLLGVRYYFSLMDRLKMYTGLGLGCTVYRVEFEDTGWYSRLAFAMDVYFGLEYEVIDRLAVGGMVNAMIPNIGPLEEHENIVGRFMVFLGVNYYIPTIAASGKNKAKARKKRR